MTAVISLFGFEGWILVLIASVPDLAYFVLFSRGRFISLSALKSFLSFVVVAAAAVGTVVETSNIKEIKSRISPDLCCLFLVSEFR